MALKAGTTARSSSAPGVSARPRDPQRWFPNQSQAGRISLLSFCLVIRIHKVQSLNKILGAQYSTYRPHVVEQMSRTYSSCVTETFCPLNSNSPFLLPQHLATSIPLYVTESGVRLFATQKPIKRQGQWKGMFAFFWKLATRGTGEGRLKNQPAKARDLSSTPGSGRPPGVGNGNPLQYFCPGNPMDRGAWWTTVQGVTKSQTGLSD